MKRRSLGRHTGRQSPYAKYKKTPYVYSAAYYAWRQTVVRHARSVPAPSAERRIAA